MKNRETEQHRQMLIIVPELSLAFECYQDFVVSKAGFSSIISRFRAD
jgi:hypothetical protein